MKIRTFTLGPLGTNGFLAAHGGRAVFVDPGGDPAPVLAALETGGLTLEAVLVTHLHCDHVYGCAALARATGAPVLVGREDLPLLDTELGGGGLMGLPLVEPFEPTVLAPGPARFLDLPCTVLHTPGHSPGSLSFHFPDQGVVFVGDVLFRRSIGRTDFPGGDTQTLLDAVRERLFTLAPETVVHSGHGPSTTVGDEMAHNPFFNGAY
jgi:glyoxylase-like metal-dependent hydrolase (beta-lactamase superfamily II)